MSSTITHEAGPTPLALLSSLRVLRDHPHEYLLQCFEEYGDVVHFQVPGNKAHFINHPDHVQHVLQMNHRNYDKDTFQYNVLSRITGKGLLTNHGGEAWLAKRRIAQPAFSKTSLQSLVPIVVESCQEMMAKWTSLDPEATLDIDREMMQVALDIVSKSLFGADLSDQAYELTGAVMAALDYLIFQTRSLGMVPTWLPSRQNQDFKRAIKRIEKVVDGLINQRSPEHPGGDLLGLLLAAKDQAGNPALSREEITHEVVTMLIAGHETVASSLTWSWYLLSQQVQIREKLHLEAKLILDQKSPSYADVSLLTYTQQVYNEALRLYPPAWLISRRAVGEDQLGGHLISAGDLMIISPYTMHRRPDLWPNPAQFDPDRFGQEKAQRRHRFGFIPFGGGPRLCIGNRFAYIEATLILALVSRQYELLFPQASNIQVEALVTLRPANGLPMKIIPRVSPSPRL